MDFSSTTEERYIDRKEVWNGTHPKWDEKEGAATYERRRFWRVRHGFWWVFHNVFVHPLLGILPIKPMFRLHDWASKKLAG